jgi:hypothetical protein
MRLFSKSPPASPRTPRPPTASPRSKAARATRTSSNASKSNNYENPYALNRVLTAHEYESDDSDAELDKGPSRYDLSTVIPGGIDRDDDSYNRYSQLGRQLAIMSDDSDSINAQWRSVDEYDTREATDVYDPLQFNREDNDWEGRNEARDNNDDYVWEAPVKESARNMRSLTDDDDDIVDYDEGSQDDDDDEDGEGSQEAGSSLSSSTTPTMKETTRRPDENQGNTPGKPKHTTAAPQAKAAERKQAQLNSPLSTADSVFKSTEAKKPSPQTQAEIIRKVTEEVIAKKMQDQNNKEISSSSQIQAEIIRKVTDELNSMRQPDEKQGNTPGKPNHMTAALPVKAAERKRVQINPQLHIADSVSKLSETTQTQAEIIGKATEEVIAEKKQDQNNDGVSSSREQNKKSSLKKGFGLFRRKSSTTQAKSRFAFRQHHSPGRSVEDPPKPFAECLDDENEHSPDHDYTAQQSPRGILKVPSFVAPPDGEVEQNSESSSDGATELVSEDNELAPKENGIFGFFLSLMGGNKEENLESPADSATGTSKAFTTDQETRKEQEPGILASICGLQQGPEGNSSEDQGFLAEICGRQGENKKDLKSNDEAVPTDDVDNVMNRSMVTEEVGQETGQDGKLNDEHLDADNEPVLVQLRDNTCSGAAKEEEKSRDADESITEIRAPEPNEKASPTSDVHIVLMNRSMVAEEVVQDGDLDCESVDYREPVFVQCLDDNNCPGAANGVYRTVDGITNMGCHQNFAFMDDFMNADDPKENDPGGASVIGARSLALDDERKKDGLPNDLPHDLPIKTIEFPVTMVSGNASADDGSGSYSSLLSRRPTGLFVDTKIEDEMRQMQDELEEGKKKKSLFGNWKERRRNRGSEE